MPAQANTLPPSLVTELETLKRRIAAMERAPAPLSVFDRYPATEWAAIGRGQTGGNKWSSCGVANVTGLVFDRVEVKYITHGIIAGEAEAEIRLAAFRHFGNAEKECISASRVLELTGNVDLGFGMWRWVHGIPFGWDYADDTTVYTIELQHRYKVGPTQSPLVQVFGMWKYEGEPDADGAGGIEVDAGSGKYTVYQEGNNRYPIGHVTIPPFAGSEGTYRISNMHYCVGLPPERLPDASEDGWAWYSGGSSQYGRDADANEDWVG